MSTTRERRAGFTAHQERMHSGEWDIVAEEVEAPDAASFLACLNARRTDEQVEVHRALAEALRAQATPTFLWSSGMQVDLPSDEVLSAARAP